MIIAILPFWHGILPGLLGSCWQAFDGWSDDSHNFKRSFAANLLQTANTYFDDTN
jgi:hypothetical protein